MNEKSRDANILINMSVTLIMRLIYLIFTFITRSLFIKILGVKILGLNAVFSNILTMLSLTEMGLNSAVLFSLYSQIASKNKEKIAAIIAYYKKLYRNIGSIIFVVGLILMLFIKNFNGIEDVEINYYYVYFLFLLNSVLTYFLSYKTIILDADQRLYIISIIKYSILILTNIIQIVILNLYTNFYAYIMVMIILNIIGNLSLGKVVDKKYSFIKQYKEKQLQIIEKKKILKDCSSLFIHRVAGFMVFGTDNLLIAYFANLESVGIYDNYYMIINNITQIVKEVLNAVKSSIGNLVFEENVKNSYDNFKIFQYICFIIYSFAVANLYNLVSPFIEVWLGNEFVLNQKIIIVILINFYITGMRTIILMYKDANGIFSQDVIKAVMEAILNLCFSIIMGISLGILGIFLGTLI